MSQPKAEQAFFQLLRLSLGREEDFPSGLTGRSGRPAWSCTGWDLAWGRSS